MSLAILISLESSLFYCKGIPVTANVCQYEIFFVYITAQYGLVYGDEICIISAKPVLSILVAFNIEGMVI